MSATSWVWVCAVLAAGLVLARWVILRGNHVTSRWGITLTRTACPTCGTAIPMARMPRSLDQALWGGATCSKCGTETDKWGRRIGSGS